MELANQVALVTGAGQGIGRASALALSAAGAHVLVADINGENAEATARTITETQRRSLAVQADVGDLQHIDRMVRQAVEEFGQIDILVNNAGVTRRADIMELTEADWDRIHRVNAKGVFFCLQRVAREMIPRRSGRIINIASIAGKGYAGTSNAAYAASKGAVIALTKTASQQLGKHNINVNSICPGITRTALSDANLRVRAERPASRWRRWTAAAPRASRCSAPTTPRTSPRWRCSSPRPARATSPANPSTSTAASFPTSPASCQPAGRTPGALPLSPSMH